MKGMSIMFNKKIFMFSLLLVLVTLLASGSSLASTTSYYGKQYSQPEQVLEKYPDPNVDFHTPAFEGENKSFTTQEEMMSFLHELTNKSNVVEMEIIGHSTEGRAIPMLLFRKGDYPNNKPTVWIEGHIHGNEPAGGETALVMADELAGEFGDDILDNINVNIVPRANPDGAYYFTRQTAKNLDANRDHVKLETPEVTSMQKAFNQYQPEVSIVGHEYGLNYNNQVFKDIGEQGSLSYYDILLNSGRHLGIPEQIRTMSSDLFIANAQQTLTNNGYSNDIYYTVSGRNEQGKPIITEPTYNADRGPSNFGLQPAFSFITETRGNGIGRESFKRRVASAVTAQKSILETTANHSQLIKQVIDNARQEIVDKGRQVSNDDKIAIDMVRKKIPNKNFTVTDIATGDPTDIIVEYLSSTEAIPTLERVRPTKYIMPPGYDEVAKKLQIGGIKVTKTKKPITIDVETFTVTNKEVDEHPFEGFYQSHVETNVSTKEIVLPKGSYVYTMAQPIANKLPISLEPESPESFVTWGFIPSEIGNELPIYRLMELTALSASDLKILVNGFESEGSLDDSASRPLQTHLTSVEHFEEKADAEKVVKHLRSFKWLLDYQSKNDLISNHAYEYLITSADSLIEIWQ